MRAKKGGHNIIGTARQLPDVAAILLALRAPYEASSPNQVLTHAARAAAKQLNKPPLVAARGAREGLWLEQRGVLFEFRVARICASYWFNKNGHF